MHHKFSDTDADPHNSKRGFFFSQIGWVCVRKNKEVIKQGNKNDISDIKADPILVFQHKHYIKLVILCSLILPTLAPMYLWNENLQNAYFLNTLRHILSVHFTGLINSAAHMWGSKPYNK